MTNPGTANPELPVGRIAILRVGIKLTPPLSMTFGWNHEAGSSMSTQRSPDCSSGLESSEKQDTVFLNWVIMGVLFFFPILFFSEKRCSQMIQKKNRNIVRLLRSGEQFRGYLFLFLPFFLLKNSIFPDEKISWAPCLGRKRLSRLPNQKAQGYNYQIHPRQVY